jgi:integrase
MIRKPPFFVSFSSRIFGQRLSISSLGFLIKDLAKNASIEKRVHPHLFRHTRLTELAKDFTKSELKVIVGIYVHLSGGDIEKKMLEKHGN